MSPHQKFRVRLFASRSSANFDITSQWMCCAYTGGEGFSELYKHRKRRCYPEEEERVPGPGIYYAGGPFLPHDENNGDPLSRVRCLRKPDFSVSDESGEGEKYPRFTLYHIIIIFSRVYNRRANRDVLSACAQKPFCI